MRLYRPSHPGTSRLLVVAMAALLLLTGCDADRSVPNAIFRPASPEATSILSLSLILLGVAAVVLVGVEAVLFLAIFRFRNRPESAAIQTHGNLKLEFGWTAATALVILVVLGLTIKTMSEVTASAAEAMPAISAFPGDSLLLKVTGHQWWWTFEYPQLGVVTANEVHVPVGRPVKLQLESADVIHSFWVPRLGGKMDTIPGHTNYTSFVATEPGVYEGVCAEFCGAQHAQMGFKIVVVPQAEFSAWVRGQQAPGAQPTNEAQRAGLQTFERSCAACHTVKGTAAQGKVGPDLTHVGSRLTIGANTLENTPANLAKWLSDTQGVKPDSKMPNLNLDPATIEQLVAYLENLK